MQCTTNDFQPFLQTGRLKKTMNLSLDDLRDKIGDTQATVYSYIVVTVKNPEGRFIQTGSAPNFQGGVISLCTCKHYMRTFWDVDQWPNTWIAGFTGKKAGKGSNALIYLMKVRVAFKSHCDLWFSDALTDTAKQAKSVHQNIFGDLFQPKPKDIRDKYDVEHYLPPVPGHVHTPKDWWHKDINYEKGVGRRKPALLIGDPQYSFLWNQPTLFLSHPLFRGHRKDNLQPLLHDYLQEIKEQQ